MFEYGMAGILPPSPPQPVVLTKSEYDGLIADRERLEWLIATNAKQLKSQNKGCISWNHPIHGRLVHWADTPREAIDKARFEK